MDALTVLRTAFAEMGLDDAVHAPVPGQLILPLRQGQLVATDSAAHLRLELQLMDGIRRNKVALWNIVHQNIQGAPFGQFYLSPQGHLCLGLNLPQGHRLVGLLPLVVRELILAGEAQARTLHAEFAELPWQDTDVRANLLHLVRTELHLPDTTAPTAEDAAPHIAQQLAAQFGEANVIALGVTEWGLPVADVVVQAALQPLPFVRQTKGQAQWTCIVSTEVGTIAQSDEKLWLALNRYNYDGCGLAAAVRYGTRKPVLRLVSELPADALHTHPDLLTATIADHAAEATHLLERLKPNYRILSTVASNFGL